MAGRPSRRTTSRKAGRLARQGFADRVLALVDSIPRGSVATYGDLAREAGFPRHARHVGRLLSALRAGTPLPWHRVLSAGGRIARRPGGGAARQRDRLRREGVSFDRRGRVVLAAHRWRFFP
jgi:methylated-DNA-protein-cysteine methyltransferase-like protein